MKILKASAGSGKTYRLSHSYLDLLLDPENIKKGILHPHRHILAVTFTNKATAEMKSRILDDLDKSEDRKARDILIDILHDYSAFNVMTNDKFFQMALRSFSREIGQMASYQVELDKKALIHEAMDRVLDNLSESDNELVGWILENVLEKIEEDERPKLENGLYTIGEKLNSAEFDALSNKEDPSYLFDKGRLRCIHTECQRIIKESDDKVAVNTARMIDKSCFELGLAAEFFKQYNAILKERNLMCLDDSKIILRDIINGSDAPFVYEKIGTRLDHYLLDEFQDTSTTEWTNFLPLLKNSDSTGGKSLIVGDVKQSIYRFRDSEWNLLQTTVPNEFPKSQTEPMKSNWRSCRNIVNFNNEFFSFASRELGCSDIYSDVVQEVKIKDESQRGRVRVSFTKDQVGEVLGSVKEALQNGAKLSEIAILVRNNDEGTLLASMLSANGFPVISDEILRIKSSKVVRRLVSVLCYLDNEKDEIGAFLVKKHGIDFPSCYHSLTDLCEHILREFTGNDKELVEGESVLINGFLDTLGGWVANNGNNLKYFLEWFEQSNLSVCSSDDSNSIRVITIHKSKGLEFPYVIFPYAEKVSLYKAGTKWCRIESNVKDFKTDIRGWYPVSLAKTYAPHSYFADAYNEEYHLLTIDNLNIFYVALTRASRELHIIADEPGKTCRSSVGKTNKVFNDMSGLLYHFCNGMDEWVSGEAYDFNRMKRDNNSDVGYLDGKFASYDLAGRLVPSQDATDFFTKDGDLMLDSGKIRLRGIILHDILSRTDKVEDLEKAVEASVENGALCKDEAAQALDLLKRRIESQRQWFEGGGLNEVTIFDAEGNENRPDRVVIEEGRTTVIDYKFGEESTAHEKQVRRYMRLLENLGYKNVVGKVWYIAADKIKDITIFE